MRFAVGDHQFGDCEYIALSARFPGGSDEPGNRQIRMQDNLRLGADTIDGTQVIFYNFQSQLGSSGNLTFSNAITEQQKQRVREIFSLYENYLGVRFVESTNLGMTIGVGDMRAIVPFPDLPGSTTQVLLSLTVLDLQHLKLVRSRRTTSWQPCWMCRTSAIRRVASLVVHSCEPRCRPSAGCWGWAMLMNCLR